MVDDDLRSTGHGFSTLGIRLPSSTAGHAPGAVAWLADASGAVHLLAICLRTWHAEVRDGACVKSRSGLDGGIPPTTIPVPRFTYLLLYRHRRYGIFWRPEGWTWRRLSNPGRPWLREDSLGYARHDPAGQSVRYRTVNKESEGQGTRGTV
jgi:hypothetical protein